MTDMSVRPLSLPLNRATRLFVSTKTVSVHVSNVVLKLDVANRIEAGRIGHDHGLRPAASR